MATREMSVSLAEVLKHEADVDELPADIEERLRQHSCRIKLVGGL